MEGQEELFEAVLNHFKEVYTSEPIEGVVDCMQVVPKLVNPDMNRQLLARVTNNEIKEAVDSLGALKAPGPDGLNGQFYQKHWETVKGEVCAAVRDFLMEEPCLRKLMK